MAFDDFRGLYLLTPDRHNSAQLLAELEKALHGRPALVQYRNKAVASTRQYAEAERVAAACREAAVPFVVNDNLALALAVEADGVHLGREDGDWRAARRRLGPHRLLGVSCYNDMALAHSAIEAGADYVAFGAVFPSQTKPGAVHAPLSLLTQARRQLPMTARNRIVAIGGITLENAASAIDAGADMLAVISDIYDAEDPGERAAAYRNLFA